MKHLILMVLLLSCAQAPKRAATPPAAVTVSDREIDACVDYKKNVLDKAYVEKNGKHVFIKDVKLAREIFSNFDVKKGLPEAKASLAANVLQQCDEASLKKFEAASKRIHRCYLTMSELNGCFCFGIWAE